MVRHDADRMEEVSNPFGISGRAGLDPATLAAAEEGLALKDKEVVDVNGLRLGRISRAFAEDGALFRLDVTLTEQAKRLLGAEQETAGVPAVTVAEVDGDTVRLSEAAEAIVHPEDPRPLHAERDERGAPGFPRKTR